MESREPWTSGERGWQRALYRLLFDQDHRLGEGFELALMGVIVCSVVTVMLESVESVRLAHGTWLKGLEWGFTLLFALEYVLRLACVKQPGRYAASFYGVVDFVAVIPTFVALLLAGGQPFLVVRVVRLLRVFRLLKLRRYIRAGDTIWTALAASRQKIAVFLMGLIPIVVIMGTLMYLIEGPEHGFTSIPTSVYWAIVTMTTVGYGDISPMTVPGQMLASLVMIMGYGIIAVPTGIVTVEFGRMRKMKSARTCPACGAAGHNDEAAFCQACGAALEGRGG